MSFIFCAQNDNFVFGLIKSKSCLLNCLLGTLLFGIGSPAFSATAIEIATEATVTDTTKNNVLGFYYGGIVILIIYNLFFYLINRSKDIFTYTAYLLSILSYQLVIDGIASQYLWPDVSGLNHIQSPIIFLVIFLCSQFGRDFLPLGQQWPFVNRSLRIINYTAIALFCLSWFLPLPIVNFLSAAVGLTTCLLLLSAGISAWLRGFYPARLFVTAWALFLCAGLVILAKNFLLLPPLASIHYGEHFGSLLGSLFLSFALADRINSIKKEKERVERISKSELETTNKTLTDNAEILRDTMDKLKKSNRLKDDFLLSISHELRTPINGIQGSLCLLKDSITEESQSEYLSIAENSTRYLLTLIDSILELNSLNQGMVTIHEKELNFFELLSDCIKTIEEPCKSKSITIETLNLSLPEVVFSDQTRLQHVINNLLSNALKFTEKGSISISSLIQKQDNNIYDFELLIKDTGIGIDPNKLDSIFDSFTQADSGYTRTHGGIGVGLSISKLIIEKMGGKVFAASIPSKGSTFIIQLPLKTPPNVKIKSFNTQVNEVFVLLPTIKPKKDTASGAITIEMSKGPLEVLVVEDLSVNQLLLKKALESLGMKPTLASNGQEAVTMVQNKHFHVILMDCQMPVMNGFEATKKIRELESQGSLSSTHIPIIAVTANTLDSDKEKCLKSGMDNYIAKPYQISSLEGAIMKHIKFSDAKEADY